MVKDKISYFSPKSKVRPEKSISLEEIFEYISGVSLLESTSLLRNIREKDKKEYREQKTKVLPSVTFGGRFDYRSSNPETLSKYDCEGLTSATGYITIDIDHISDLGLDKETLKEKLLNDKELGVSLVYTSPSGDGLKAVCYTSATIDTEKDYYGVFKAIEKYINSTYGDIVDPAGSDITRMSLICHDKDAIYKETSTPFNPELHPIPEEEKLYTPFALDPEDNDLYTIIENTVSKVESRGINLGEGYSNYLKLVYSFKSLGESGRSLLHRVCRIDEGYNERNTDIDFNYNNCRFTDIRYFINRAKENGIDISEFRDYQKRMKEEERRLQQEEELDKELIQYLKPIDRETLKDLASIKREGLRTGYIFGETQGRKEELLLRNGAITLICGKSSHGKSKFLQNLAINTATNLRDSGEEGEVLFFTYEEDLPDISMQFANIYANVTELSQYGTKNIEVIRDYFSSGDMNKATREKRGRAVPKLQEFESLLESGRLRLFYTDKSSIEFCSLLRKLSQKIKIKAVFVDYVQIMYRDSYSRSRLDEIKDICNDLRKTSIELNLPLILGAQLNRKTENPLDMSSDNIADSADLTRYANTICCIWNSSFSDVNKEFKDSRENNELEGRGFKLGDPGKMYARLTKNRGGTPNIDAIFKFEGETGRIEINDDIPEDNTPKRGLFSMKS